MSVFMKRDRFPRVAIYPEKDTLENMTWRNISKVCKAGLASEYWTVGDTKTIKISGEEYTAEIIGFDHDDVTDSTVYGREKTGITLQLKELLKQTYQMNTTNTNVGGWRDSYMRNTVMNSLFNSLDTNLQNVIIGVNKKTNVSKNVVETTTDKLFLLSEVEITGSITNSNSGEGQRYAYYIAGNSASKKVKGGSTMSWWERSPIFTTAYRYCVVYTNGNQTYSNANNNFGVSFAFCI